FNLAYSEAPDSELLKAAGIDTDVLTKEIKDDLAAIPRFPRDTLGGYLDKINSLGDLTTIRGGVWTTVWYELTDPFTNRLVAAIDAAGIDLPPV
ncbi:MAG: hypothetical protein AAB834_06755, partial [Patescibacteria group bacterium]